MLAGHQQKIQADRDRELEAAEGTAEGSPPAVRVTDETDYFRLADHPGYDAIFVNTSAFIVTYVVKLSEADFWRAE
jgi:hypothetical protein